MLNAKNVNRDEKRGNVAELENINDDAQQSCIMQRKLQRRVLRRRCGRDRKRKAASCWKSVEEVLCGELDVADCHSPLFISLIGLVLMSSTGRNADDGQVSAAREWTGRCVGRNAQTDAREEIETRRPSLFMTEDVHNKPNVSTDVEHY